MTDIDPEKLEEDIAALEKWFARYAYLHDVSPEGIQRVLEAARVTLATLPRWKEETFTRYLVVSEHEESGPYADLVDAESVARRLRGTIVRLTGTAKVKVQ